MCGVPIEEVGVERGKERMRGEEKRKVEEKEEEENLST